MTKTYKHLQRTLEEAISRLDPRQKKVYQKWVNHRDEMDLLLYDPDAPIGQDEENLEALARTIQEIFAMLDEQLQADTDAKDADAFRRVIRIIKEEWNG